MTGVRTKRIIRRLACALAGLATAVLTSAGTIPAAFAMEVPPPPGGPPLANLKHPPVPIHTHAAVAIGMPGWQITLIALASALLAAVLAVVLDRAIMARRRGIAHPA
jgi:hypothetical protein